VDNQQLGNFSQSNMENIVNAKVQKLEAAFTRQMQTLLATQQKTAQNYRSLCRRQKDKTKKDSPG
jgi:hypothetical protein